MLICGGVYNLQKITPTKYHFFSALVKTFRFLTIKDPCITQTLSWFGLGCDWTTNGTKEIKP